MRAYKDIVEPSSIVIAFTIGTLINRRSGKKKSAIPPKRDLEVGTAPNEDGKRPAASDRSGKSAAATPPHIFQRFLNYFPFLMEILYWNLTYWIYQLARAYSACRIRGHVDIFDRARSHAVSILNCERRLGIDIELRLQQYILHNVPRLKDILAQIYYSHILVGVIFIIYIYTYLPRPLFQKIRRTIALDNWLAFIIVTTWRCMPPRLLPAEFGYIDVLHQKPQSVWNNNGFQLTIAAMPSLHFGTSAFIAVCLFRFCPHPWVRMIAPLWPMAMLLTILATANHFVLDAVVGAIVPFLGWRWNRVILVLEPLETRIFSLFRMKKPELYAEDEEASESTKSTKSSGWLL